MFWNLLQEFLSAADYWENNETNYSLGHKFPSHEIIIKAGNQVARNHSIFKFKQEASIEEGLFDILSVDNITSVMYLMRDQ